MKMISTLWRKLTSRPAPAPEPAMSLQDRFLIWRYAVTQKDVHRAPATEAYLRNLSVFAKKNPYMNFMSEVENLTPDINLRAHYRKRVQETFEAEVKSVNGVLPDVR